MSTKRRFGIALVGSVLLTSLVSPTRSHNSVKDVEEQLEQTERYVQLVDQPAPRFSLLDPDGRSVTLESFGGRVVILNFIYARCKDTCPLHSALLAKVQQQLEESRLSEQIQFVTVATDTGEDPSETAAIMREHGLRHHLDSKNWVFLHGGPEAPNAGITLAAGYGLKFVPTPEGDQMHGVVTHLIDSEGRMRARYHGLGFDPLSLTLHAAALVHGNHGADAEEMSAETPQRPWITIVIGLASLLVLAYGSWWLTANYRQSRTTRAQPRSRHAAASVEKSSE